jgi:MFS family permease
MLWCGENRVRSMPYNHIQCPEQEGLNLGLTLSVQWNRKKRTDNWATTTPERIIIFSFLKDRLFYGWIVLAAGLLIAMIGLGTRYSFGVFLKSIEGEFGVSRGESSGIFSAYMLFCGLLSIIGGWALDRYGPRRVAFVMASFTGLSLLLTGQANAAWQMFITYGLLLSLGTGPVYTVVNSTSSRWFRRKRGFAVGITSSGGGLGAIIIAPFASYLVSRFDWRTAFVVLGLVSWIVMATMSLLLKKDPVDMGLLPDGAKSEPHQKDMQTKGGKTGPTDYGVVQASKMSQFWFLGLTWVFVSLSLHLIFVHAVPYAVDMGISPMDAAVILSLIGVANIPGRLVIGKISDTVDRKALGVACALVQTGTLLWLMWAHGLWMLYIFAIVFGFLWGGSGAVVTALIGDVFGTRSLGAIMGMMSAGWALGAAIGPAMGGYIFDASGSYFAAFATGAFAILISALFVALIKRRKDYDDEVQRI